MEQPAEMGNTIGLWEAHVSNYFLNGLRPEIAAAVKSSCIMWEEARIEKIRRHACHAEKELAQEKIKHDEKQTKDLHMAALTMYQAVQANTVRGRGRMHNTRGRHHGGRGRGGARSRINYDPDVCFKCQQRGHWAKDCLNNPHTAQQSTAAD